MIEYVTKNEETDELELKPISYGIPEIASKEDPTALDYENAVIENWPVAETWTATKRGMVTFTCDLTNWDITVNYRKKDGSSIRIGGIRSTNTTFTRGTITFLVSPGDTFFLGTSGAGGPTMLDRLFVPFKVQYD